MPPAEPHPDDATMSFGDHLEELRRRMLLALVAPLPLFIIVFFLSDQVLSWLLIPVYDVLRSHGLSPELQVLSPPEFLLAELKLSLIAALVLAAPWLLWQTWKFVAPGLYLSERRFVHFLLPGSAVLTVAGIALLYYVMLPLMLHVLIMFAASADIGGPAPDRDARVTAALAAAPAIAVRAVAPDRPAAGDAWLLVPDLEFYVALPGEDGAVEVVRVEPLRPGGIEQKFRISFVINFILVLMLGVAIAFQMPLVILLLGWLNLVSVAWLRARRRYALGLCAVIAAVITPADVASMLIMLVPLYGLYEFGILLLMVAPASSVAEGRVGRRGGSDNSGGGAGDGDAR